MPVEQQDLIVESKRELLKLMGMIPLALVGNQVLPVDSELDLNDFKKTIEQEFTIEIYTLRDLPQEDRRRILIRQDHLQAAPHFWDQGRLTLLQDILLILPAHFYQKDQSGQRVKLILSIRDRSDAFEPDPRGHIQLDYRGFHPINPGKGLERLAHELSHSITPLETTHTQILPDFYVRKIDSPWFKKIDEALGESYQQARQRFYYEILEKRNKLPLNHQEKWHFYDDLGFAFSFSDHPAEVIGYLSGHFIHGWNWFSRMYEECFHQSIVDKLYQFAKDDIFCGTEYHG